MNQELPAEVKNYLRKFGFTKWSIETSTNKLFNTIVVIPAIEESKNIPKLLASLSENNSDSFAEILFVIVINNLESSSVDVKTDNQKLLSYLRKVIVFNDVDELAKKVVSKKMNLAVVDACSSGAEMPEKDGGVGYARKIGMDLALSFFDYNSTKSKILVCLDSDCLVSKNYTLALNEINEKKYPAGYIEYEHLLPEDNKEKTAIIIYEIFLRYYVLGLKYASSPFAFDTIGSTMFCDVDSYIKIGGMNKKKAAEDFYFMEKLAKINNMRKVSTAKVFPSPRRSWRVPFGTGQRINRFFDGTHDEYSLYNPVSFEILRRWHEVFFDDQILSVNEYLTSAEKIDSALKVFLTGQSFAEAWEKILNETTKKEQLQKQKHFWFDGFRTLKLIHYLRDSKYPAINIFDALNQIFAMCAFKVDNEKSAAEWQIQFEYLKMLRTINNS
ncbi:MAG: hypothetical protein FD143_2712 [Ignavibacteria bacterium]|nr:MAG: hypothetical protein FD143_2712 [Ignavibacteria bacterium]KAF0157790.1 MAG: hypothetical protein FD188_2668 [Ignavibacteria bacterium]